MVYSFKKIIPSSLRQKRAVSSGMFRLSPSRGLANSSSKLTEPSTVAQGWDNYAQNYVHRQTRIGVDYSLGDEWNQPEEMGIDVPANEILEHLDRTVFQPFLEKCEVLLEIGPGGGRFTEILLPKCHKLIAADTSQTMLKVLSKRFKDSEKIEYLLLDGKSLSAVADKSVDGAFSYGVFVHLQHWDIYNYLVELQRILKPGGRGIIQHANTFSELGWQKFIKQLPGQLSRHKLPGSFTVMTPQIMQEFTQRAGLKLEKCVTDTVRRDCISLIKSPE